jgi:hypothetical protein
MVIGKQLISCVFKNLDSKMLVVVGIFHVFKKIVWQDHVLNKSGSRAFNQKQISGSKKRKAAGIMSTRSHG